MAATERPHRYGEPDIVVLVPSSSRGESDRSRRADALSRPEDIACVKVEQEVTTDRGQSWFLDFKGSTSKVRAGSGLGT